MGRLLIDKNSIDSGTVSQAKGFGDTSCWDTALLFARLTAEHFVITAKLVTCNMHEAIVVDDCLDEPLVTSFVIIYYVSEFLGVEASAPDFVFHLLDECRAQPLEEILRARLRRTTSTATYVVGEVRNFEARSCHTPRAARHCRHRRREAPMAKHIRRLEYL